MLLLQEQRTMLVVKDVNPPVQHFLSVLVYLWHEITQSMGLVYWYGSKVPPKYISFLYWKGPFSSNFSKWYIWKQSLYSKWILFYYIFVLFINSSVCVYINCTCLVGGENVRENWWAVFSNGILTGSRKFLC